MIVLGFTGKKENGKSTVCEMIEKKIEKKFFIQRVNFKDPLVAVAFWLGWNGMKDERGRRGLQLLGTDVVRECFNKDHWANAWTKTVQEKSRLGYELILADDVRFENEAQAIKSFGGKIVFIESPGKNVNTDTHKSEAGIPMSYIDRSFMNVPVGLQHLNVIAETIIKEFIDGQLTTRTA